MSDMALGTGQVKKSGFSIEALQESKAALAVIGAALFVGVVVMIFYIWEAFLGHLTPVVKVNATLPLGSNAVDAGAPVIYNYVTVGKIVSESQAPGGAVAAKLALYPSTLKAIPSNVQVQVVPESVFGNQELVLVVPPGTKSAATSLTAAVHVPPYAAAPSTSLQGSASTIYDLLTAVKPADLMTALDSVATALQGEGTSLGQSLVAGSHYLGALDPHLSTVAADLQLLSPVSNSFANAAPAVVGTIANSSVSAQTITAQATQISDLLTEGNAAAGQFTQVLSQVQTSLPTLLNDSGPLLSDVTANPNELKTTLAGLGQWAAAWASAESHGPFIEVNATLPLANLNDAVDAALGQGLPQSLAGALGASHFNPPTYTAADCPQFPGEANPYCGTGGSPAASPMPASDPGPSSGASASSGSTGAPAGGTPATYSAPPSSGAGAQSASPYSQTPSPYAQAQQAALAIATAFGGGRPVAQPAMATMLLLPLLASMSAGSR
jgi:phospholipid/cholesterol/gamma-HCH transport system substrate-binding protein